MLSSIVMFRSAVLCTWRSATARLWVVQVAVLWVVIIVTVGSIICVGGVGIRGAVIAWGIWVVVVLGRTILTVAVVHWGRGWIAVWSWSTIWRSRLCSTNSHSHWNGHNTPHHYSEHHCGNIETQWDVGLCPGSCNVTTSFIIPCLKTSWYWNFMCMHIVKNNVD